MSMKLDKIDMFAFSDYHLIDEARSMHILMYVHTDIFCSFVALCHEQDA